MENLPVPLGHHGLTMTPLVSITLQDVAVATRLLSER
jgi:hypothetical protein